jgi:hypothetical protein
VAPSQPLRSTRHGAVAVKWAVRVDFPEPASPPTQTVVTAPLRASSSAADSARSSSDRSSSMRPANQGGAALTRMLASL